MRSEKDTQPTCSVCRSPLLPEAVQKGKCQCCGAELEGAQTADSRDVD